MPPQITCASALPGKTRKHENHIFHSIGLCYTHNAPEKLKLSSVMCLIASNIVEVLRYPINTVHWLFSEHELTFTFAICTFAICCRPSVCRLSVCLSVVCNVRAPYSCGSNFRQYFYSIRYLGHPLTFTENFTEVVPGEPLRRGS